MVNQIQQNNKYVTEPVGNAADLFRPRNVRFRNQALLERRQSLLSVIDRVLLLQIVFVVEGQYEPHRVVKVFGQTKKMRERVTALATSAVVFLCEERSVLGRRGRAMVLLYHRNLGGALKF